MSSRMKWAIGGVVVGVIAWWILPWWIGFLIILGAIGIPLAGYLMLDPSQRKRLNNQARKRLG